MSNREHQPSRARQRAGWELAWAILAGVALGLALTFAPSWAYASQSKNDVARTDVRTLIAVVETWRFDDFAARKHACPSRARGNDCIAMSAGPDGRYGTADDITAEASP